MYASTQVREYTSAVDGCRCRTTIDGLLRRSAFRSLRRISFWSASARCCRFFRAHIGHTSNVMRPVATGGAPTSKSSLVHKLQDAHAAQGKT